MLQQPVFLWRKHFATLVKLIRKRSVLRVFTVRLILWQNVVISFFELDVLKRYDSAFCSLPSWLPLKIDGVGFCNAKWSLSNFCCAVNLLKPILFFGLKAVYPYVRLGSFAWLLQVGWTTVRTELIGVEIFILERVFVFIRWVWLNFCRPRHSTTKRKRAVIAKFI